MNIVEVTQPPVEPLSLEQAKAYLRQDVLPVSAAVTLDDEMVSDMIVAARRRVEQMTNRSYIQRRLRLVTDELPRVWNEHACGCWHITPRAGPWGRLYVELPRSPVIAVHTVEYRNVSDGMLTEVTGWYCDVEQMPARLYMGNAFWPTSETLRIEYTAGLADTGSPSDYGAALVPAEVRQAMRFHLQLSNDELPADKREKLNEAILGLLESLVVYTL